MPKILHEPRENILSAAQTELREKGVRGFNIRDVAKLSGVAIGTIYNYYGDKYRLVVEVAKDLFREKIDALIVEYPEGRGLEEGVASVYEAIRGFKKEHDETLKNIFDGAISGEELAFPKTLELLNKVLESAKKTMLEEEKAFLARAILWAVLSDNTPLEVLQKVAIALAR